MCSEDGPPLPLDLQLCHLDGNAGRDVDRVALRRKSTATPGEALSFQLLPRNKGVL